MSVQRCATEGEAATFKEPQVWAGGSVRVESLKAAADLLQTLTQPFLNWSGKAERHQISVPTVPLFVHERNSTKAILEGIVRDVRRGPISTCSVPAVSTPATGSTPTSTRGYRGEEKGDAQLKKNAEVLKSHFIDKNKLGVKTAEGF